MGGGTAWGVKSHKVRSRSCCGTLQNFGGRRSVLMVSVLDSGSSGQGSSPGRGHCAVFFGKTLYSHSASLHLSVQMGTGKLNAGG